MKRLIALLVFALCTCAPLQAQTPPEELSFFDTWRLLGTDSLGTGARHLYAGIDAPQDSAEVAYGASSSVFAYRALVDDTLWARAISGETFPISVELGEIEHYIYTNPTERERLEWLLNDRDVLMFRRFFGPAPTLTAPETSGRAQNLVVSLRETTTLDAARAVQGECDVTNLIGECIEPPVPVVRHK